MYIRLAQICRCLGYHNDLASYMADLRLYEEAPSIGNTVTDNVDPSACN